MTPLKVVDTSSSLVAFSYFWRSSLIGKTFPQHGRRYKFEPLFLHFFLAINTFYCFAVLMRFKRVFSIYAFKNDIFFLKIAKNCFVFS